MVKEQTRLVSEARRRLADHVPKGQAQPAETRVGGAEHVLASIDARLAKLTDALEADLTKREVAALPTWPFDTGVIGRLTVIILFVAAILISRFILISVGL